MKTFLLAIIFLTLSYAPNASGKGVLECADLLDAECIKANSAEPYRVMILERVIDGDTIVASGQKIRLWGIDTPEKDEPHFLAAKMLLESLLKDGELSCKFIEEDRYQRSVMHCLIDGLDIGSMMVRVGMAKDYSRYSGDYYQYEENLAKSEKLGIWTERYAPDE